MWLRSGYGRNQEGVKVSRKKWNGYNCEIRISLTLHWEKKQIKYTMLWNCMFYCL